MFATPFVIVASCKRPIESRREVEPAPERVATAVAVADATVAVADAAVPPDAPIDALDRGAAARRSFPPCPGPYDPPDPNGLHCNPPRPQPSFVVRARALQVQGADTIVRLDVGEDRGVRKGHTTAEFLDGEDPLQGGRCEVIRVLKTSTVCRTKLTPDQIDAHPRVRLRFE